MPDAHELGPFESHTPMQKAQFERYPERLTEHALMCDYADNVSFTSRPTLLRDIQARVKPVYRYNDITGAVCVPHGENGETVLYITYEHNPQAFYAVYFKAKVTTDTTAYLKN